MTALIAAEESDLSSEVTAYVDGIALFFETGSTIMGIEPGQTFILEDLLYGLLLPSGNDAAIAIAEYIGGDIESFVGLMNLKARGLELVNTRFATPDGRDAEDQYASAFDMTILGRYLLRQPDLAAMVATQTYQPLWDGPPLFNTNPLLYDYPGAIGIKVGFTPDSKDTGVIAAERGGRILVATVLQSDDLYSDVSLLLDWAFDATAAQCPSSSIDPNT
jgi:D-alanyl-D-alanine carboxypeptidase (penicillin-binding protein 5/6)